MDAVQRLKEAGVDYDAAMKRFRNKEQIYFKYLFRLPEEPLVREAEEAFEKNDEDKAVFAVHTLKSIIGNLSINGLYDTICSVMTELRSGGADRAKRLYLDDFLPAYAKICEVVKAVRG